MSRTASTTDPSPERAGPRVSIRLKLLLLAALSVLLLLSVAGWQTWQNHQAARDSRQAGLRHTVELALSVLRWAQAQEQAGSLDRARAQALALSVLKPMRYGGNEYFWVNDMAPRVVMHPIKPELDGKDVSATRDPEGNPLFVRFVETVRRDQAGYVRYLWPKPGQEQPVEKVSYVAGFAPWGWVVGSGVYMDDLRAEFHQHLAKVGAVLALALGVLLWTLHRVHASIARGLGRALEVAGAIAQGDVSQAIAPEGDAEIRQLLAGMARMSGQLNRTMGEVRASALALAQASEEIAQANQDLSGRTERAAGSLQQAAASLSQITQSVQGNARAAELACGNASAASQVAEEGGASVAQAVRAMGDIQRSAQRIGDILGVIDSIAFQTNILALNAAVEAARAGESGRGFAVVAAEVRQLAQRSAQAAREIKDLIGESAARTTDGTRLVEAAGATMQRVVASVRDVNGLIGDITAATVRQSEGLGAVNLSVSSLDDMTQHNAALVEQSASAADALRDQATRLSEAVQRFRLDEAALQG